MKRLDIDKIVKPELVKAVKEMEIRVKIVDKALEDLQNATDNFNRIKKELTNK